MIESLFHNWPLLVYVASLHLVISVLAVAWSQERNSRRRLENEKLRELIPRPFRARYFGGRLN